MVTRRMVVDGIVSQYQGLDSVWTREIFQFIVPHREECCSLCAADQPNKNHYQYKHGVDPIVRFTSEGLEVT